MLGRAINSRSVIGFEIHTARGKSHFNYRAGRGQFAGRRLSGVHGGAPDISDTQLVDQETQYFRTHAETFISVSA